jgi:ribonuclease D
VDERSEPAQPAERTSRAVPLSAPREGLPQVIDQRGGLDAASSALRAGHGPVAVDTERASGYRYFQRAYLVQLRRAGAGTFLIDPIPFGGSLPGLAEALDGTEWVLHAASQDLPCLAELGLRPAALFDTELAARLAGYERVALGTMVENVLGYRIEKGHGAADWSRRPLPTSWLSYAALDVELLIPLRSTLSETLRTAGKLGWAEQEFEAVRTASPRPGRVEEWRRTSGIHKVRTSRALASVRALWQAREDVARRRDLARGRILPDKAIITAALSDPDSARGLSTLPGFRNPAQRRLVRTWAAALRKARELPKAELPQASPPAAGPPPPNRWTNREPAAADRLSGARETLEALAAHHEVPVENLLAPDLLRRLCWNPPQDIRADGLAAALRASGARPWQVALTAEPLAQALRDPTGEPPEGEE